MPNIGAIELLFILLLLLIPMVLAIVLASRKGLEPLWLWVVLALFFPLIMLVVTLIVPRRGPSGGA
jgi:hypothetical protein